jgi:hypothetical protein
MPKEEGLTFQLDDADGNRLHAIWSRSGRRLIISLFSQRGGFESKGQAELTHDQVEQLSAFLAESKPR